MGDISYDWDGGLCRHLWLDQGAAKAYKQDVSCHTDPVSDWLTRYFNAEHSALPELQDANTSFQQRMRAALLKITPGKTMTYGQLAMILHTSPRAIGQALKANRLPILIPCHRIVAAKGLGGFNCGQTWKMNLLKFEGCCVP